MWYDSCPLGGNQGLSEGRERSPGRNEGSFGDEKTETELRPGNPLNRSCIGAMVARLGKKAGIEKRVSPHVLRHTAATRMLRAVGDIALVSKFLGHADASTSMICSHLVTEDLANGLAKVGAQEPEEAEETEAEKVARQLLENLPAEVREALGRLSGEREVRQP